MACTFELQKKTCCFNVVLNIAWILTTPWRFKISFIWKNVYAYLHLLTNKNLLFFLSKLELNGFQFWIPITCWDSDTNFGWIWATVWRFKLSCFWRKLFRLYATFNQENYKFFLGKLNQYSFPFQKLHTKQYLHTKLGSIWTPPWRFEVSYNWKKFISFNLLISYEIIERTNFFFYSS